MRVALLVLATLLLSQGICWAATLVVGPGSYRTIQAGINAASDGDTVLVQSGTYTGPGNKELHIDGKAIWLRSESLNPLTCIIDCADDGRGFTMVNSYETSTTVIEGFTIKNGHPC